MGLESPYEIVLVTSGRVFRHETFHATLILQEADETPVLISTTALDINTQYTVYIFYFSVALQPNFGPWPPP
jgi:methyl coenzyme M reductase subunit C